MRKTKWQEQVDKRIPEEMFVQLLAKKANIIQDHL